MDFGGSWDKSLSLIEFYYNNNYHSSIDATTYEVLYGRKCRSPLCWDDISDQIVLGPQRIQDTMEQIRVVQERMKATQDRHKAYADKGRWPEAFEVGENVFLKLSPTKGIVRFGKKGKLGQKYIGHSRYWRE